MNVYPISFELRRSSIETKLDLNIVEFQLKKPKKWTCTKFR